MNPARLLRFLYPQYLLLMSLTISIAAWLLAGVGGLLQRFFAREHLTVKGLFVLSFWYGAIFFCSAIGFRFGRRLIPSARYREMIPLSKPTPYRILVLFAIIGTIATYYRIGQLLGLAGIMQSLTRNTANDLKAALYQDYSKGLFSLRYLSSICGGVAAWRILNRSRSVFDIAAILCCLATALVSSRVTLIWAGLTALSFWLTSIERVSSKVVLKLAFAGVALIILLLTLNYSRNANYYKSKGVGGFAGSGLNETVAYLGVPFQVSLGVANNIEQALDGVPSDQLVQWDPALNANSAFEQIIPSMGYFGLPYMLVTVLLYSAAAGFCFRMRGTWLFIGFPAIAYAFAEVWRLDAFRQGVYYTNVILGIGIPALIARLPVSSRQRFRTARTRAHLARRLSPDSS